MWLPGSDISVAAVFVFVRLEGVAALKECLAQTQSDVFAISVLT